MWPEVRVRVRVRVKVRVRVGVEVKVRGFSQHRSRASHPRETRQAGCVAWPPVAAGGAPG